MVDREIVRANAVVHAVCNANAADISAVPRPGGAAIGAQAIVLGLEVECDDANPA
jgi:hypothetical protein